ncbi:MAG: tetratricopeptide repeat-containing protein [Acidobacteriota bacterium]
MAEKKKASQIGGAGVVATAADLFGSAVRTSLELSALPVKAIKYLPETGLLGWPKDAVRLGASFPRAVGKAFDRFAANMEELGGGGDIEAEADLDKPGVHTFRNEQKDTAIVFIHGFGQNSENTWGKFLYIVSEEARLEDWDIFSVGYTTNMMMDVAGLWSASPPIDRLAQYMMTVLTSPPLARYKSLALVAHSMGGLVTQRTLVDFAEVRDRVGHVICYGTPSGGLKKAALIKSWKRQIRDMSKDSSFIVDLRERWSKTITDEPPFTFKVAAGDQDEFVPSWSTLEPFDEKFRFVVPGNHLTIVSPPTNKHLSVELLVKHLAGEQAAGGPWNSARVAIEGRQFQKAIDTLWPHRTELDDGTKVMLSLALDSVGRRQDAIEVLKSSGRESTTDQMGTLGGRLKRRWLLERRKEDADGAKKLYADGLAAAEEAKEPAQVFYLAINVAFMALAVDNDKKTSRKSAQKALDNTAKAEEDVWNFATQGEANLYLGNDDAALEGYRAALEKTPKPWQLTSMFQQAVQVAELLDNEAVADRLRSLFRESGG